AGQRSLVDFAVLLICFDCLRLLEIVSGVTKNPSRIRSSFLPDAGRCVLPRHDVRPCCGTG
ncbi:MAG: hypothetical protein QM686_19030, partial [Herbaspirillum sp.]